MAQRRLKQKRELNPDKPYDHITFYLITPRRNLAAARRLYRQVQVGPLIYGVDAALTFFSSNPRSVLQRLMASSRVNPVPRATVKVTKILHLLRKKLEKNPAGKSLILQSASVVAITTRRYVWESHLV
jgi:hypothetical protein